MKCVDRIFELLNFKIPSRCLTSGKRTRQGAGGGVGKRRKTDEVPATLTAAQAVAAKEAAKAKQKTSSLELQKRKEMAAKAWMTTRSRS